MQKKCDVPAPIWQMGSKSAVRHVTVTLVRTPRWPGQNLGHSMSLEKIHGSEWPRTLVPACRHPPATAAQLITPRAERGFTPYFRHKSGRGPFIPVYFGCNAAIPAAEEPQTSKATALCMWSWEENYNFHFF